MAKFTAKIYVLEHIWDERWIELDADTVEQAEEKIKEYDYEITHSQMGELEWTNQDTNIDWIKSDEINLLDIKKGGD